MRPCVTGPRRTGPAAAAAAVAVAVAAAAAAATLRVFFGRRRVSVGVPETHVSDAAAAAVAPPALPAAVAHAGHAPPGHQRNRTGRTAADGPVHARGPPVPGASALSAGARAHDDPRPVPQRQRQREPPQPQPPPTPPSPTAGPVGRDTVAAGRTAAVPAPSPSAREHGITDRIYRTCIPRSYAI